MLTTYHESVAGEKIMSVQFGRWNFEGKPAAHGYVEKVHAILAPYGPDGGSTYSDGRVDILYRSFHTTKESLGKTQPHVSRLGAVIAWDGRLDNRVELISRFKDVLTIEATDVSIVAAAYDEWGADCLGRLVGDWAVSIWNPNTCSVILAKDHVGTRQLYYSLDQNHFTWSTILDPLILLSGTTFMLEKEYVAGWLAFFPAAHLTPYVGIHSVPPSSCVSVEIQKHTVRRYWSFDPGKKIRYRTDAEYEEHFRAVFAESVRRRLRSDRPILAELSGGMDSSSIVCMVDALMARGAAETGRVDTISYYNDSEPNWNERPYFTKVEEKRGRSGCHIDFGLPDSFTFDFENASFGAIPGSGKRLKGTAKQFAAFLQSQNARCVLSGIGGDEVLGGVPTPGPELEDLLVKARFRDFARQLRVWALNKRKPWLHLLFETVRVFFPPALFGVPKHRRPAPWLHPSFVKENRTALNGYGRRLKLCGPSPTFQENISALDALRRQLACEGLTTDALHEKRYPYLDRDLLEFLYAIPREQLVRPGQRRSLMRRALVGIVPDELLNRKRKAFVSRGPIAAIVAEWTSLLDMSRHMIMNSLNIVDPQRFAEALQKARQGQEILLVPLLRTLYIEFWLRNLNQRGILAETDKKSRDSHQGLALTELSAEKS